jgi:hypothetical protein
MKVFTGWRREPPQEYIDEGITNGPDKPDYEGVVFSDGTVVLNWLTLAHSVAVFPTLDMFMRIHGHPEYGTRIEWHEVNA